MEVLLPLLTALIGATIAAMLAYFFRGQLTRKERVRATIEMYWRYNSPEMVLARSEAWDYLENQYPDVLAPWQELWKGGCACTPAYDSLVQVTGFLYMIGVLEAEGGIVRSLAADLLGHDFELWVDKLGQLYQATKQHTDNVPAWMGVFGNRGPGGEGLHSNWAWLVRP